MSKGFSTLELAIIISCAGIAFDGASKDGPVSLGAIASQVKFTYQQKDTFNADKYLRQVANSLERINNS